jgi:hypothetical protein
MKIIPKEEIKNDDYYGEIVETLDLCGLNPIYIEDENGTYRFQSNSIVRYLVGSSSLNLIWGEAGEKEYSLREFLELYIHMGYSLGGYLEIFGEAIDKILRISYDYHTGDRTSKLGYDEESIKFFDKPVYESK